MKFLLISDVRDDHCEFSTEPLLTTKSDSTIQMSPIHTCTREAWLVALAHLERDVSNILRGHEKGMPLCVLTYRLERVMLIEMLREYAERFLTDSMQDIIVAGGGNISSSTKQRKYD